MMNIKNSLRQVKIVVAAVFYSLLVGSNLLLADDTEVFFGAQTAQSTSRPNVLFILDTSGSMSSKDGGSTTRIDRMKDAVREILSSATNINVGMMRFNGAYGGGPILYPVTYIDEELCPNGVCQDGGNVEVSLSFQVNSSADDAVEATNSLSVKTSDPILNFFQSDTTYNTTATDTYRVDKSKDFQEQRPSGGNGWNNSGDLDSFYDGGEISWGLRFNNVVVPPGSTITNAYVRFYGYTNSWYNQGLVVANIFGEDVDDAKSFKNQAGRRVLERTRTAQNVNWSIPFVLGATGGTVDTPDLSTIFEHITSRPGFSSGSDEIALIFENDWSSNSSDSSHRRHLYSPRASSSYRPKLYLSYSQDALDSQKIGLRFDDVKIPQGATITSASLEFASAASHSTATNATIYAHDTDDSPQFSNSNGNISARTKTSASTNWSISNWSDPVPNQSAPIEQSADISSVVQEVVDRSGWCGGNALAFIVEGSGLREAIAYDSDPEQAPVLKISYDASGIPVGGGCTTATAVSSISVGTDDVEQLSSGQVIRTDSELKVPMHTGLDNITGLRFTDIKVPKNANVKSAYLSMSAALDANTSTSWTIQGEAAGDSSFFTATTNELSNRNKVSITADWNNVSAVTAGDTIQSPDLSQVLLQITSQAGWASGNSLALFVKRKSGTGNRSIKTYEAEPLKAARLVIQYEVAPGSVPPDIQDQISYLTTRQKMTQILDDMKLQGYTPAVPALYEAAKYFKGESIDYGIERGFGSAKHKYHRVSHPASYTGGSVNRSNQCSNDNLNSNDCKSENITGSPVYVSPMNDVCQSNHIVLLTDGYANKNNAKSRVESMIGSSCTSSGGGQCGVELAAYLKNNDQSTTVAGNQDISVHTIGFNNNDPWLTAVADAGGGVYQPADSASSLVTAFNNILASILKVDTTFVSPGATVNQFNRLTHRNDIYFSLFKPSEKPTWSGNLKQYRLDGNPARLVDADGQDAIDQTTGFFNENSRSFWSNSTDGNNVALGGAANELKLAGRKVFTYTGSSTLLSHSSNSLHENNSYLNKSMLGVSGQSNAYFDNLVKWARGVDVKDENDDGNTNDIRKHIGDPMHSRPVIVNYSATESVIYVGTNEGFIHAVAHDDGHEIFSFIPAQLLPNLDKFYSNQASTDHPYGLDGHITSWSNSANGKKYIFFGMRRGGNKYYALDVTNKNSPKLQWIIDGDTNPAFSQLGQTWSKAIATKIKISGSEKNVLIFSGGYDQNQDLVNVTTEDSVGNAVYIVDINNGSVIWSAGKNGSGASKEFGDMKYSMPSAVTVVDIDFDGLADQMYIGDMGGQLWRFDIDNNSTSVSALVKGGVMANLSESGIPNTRRFYYAPDISLLSNEGVPFLAISIGSGWRAHPLDQAVNERFYMIRSKSIFTAPEGYGKDNGNGTFSVITEDDLQDVTNDQEPDMSIGEGWMIQLESPGEKVLAQSVTINNQIIFTTYRPEQSATACSTALGGGAVYIVDAGNGSAVLNLDGQGTDEDLEKTDRVIELSHGGIPPEAVALFPSDINNGNGLDPVVLIGPEQIDDIDFGDLTQRTFWQNNPEGAD